MPQCLAVWPTHAKAFHQPLPCPQVRRSGSGGAFLLFTTRQHQLHTVSLVSLVDGTAAGLLAGGGVGQPAVQQQQPAAGQGFRAAMKAAMRPTGAGAAAAEAGSVNVRSVEQNAVLVAVPPGEQTGQCMVLFKHQTWVKQCIPFLHDAVRMHFTPARSSLSHTRHVLHCPHHRPRR